MTLPADFAVYAEHSDGMKGVESGWNARIFNRIEVQEGSNIRLDATTGTIVLEPGLYHITGSSQVTYNDLAQNPSAPGWNTEIRPNGGYCRLRYAADKDCPNDQAIIVGTISNANMLPSMVDTYLNVTDRTEIILEHQVGFDEISGMYLQDNTTGSSWHVFARIAVRHVAAAAATHERSALNSALCAAFGDYLRNPEAYRRLYCSYLGVTPKFVPICTEGAWVVPGKSVLADVLERGILRFGYVDTPPYVYRSSNGQLAGFDWELGNGLAAIIREQYFFHAPGKGLRAEWVEVKPSSEGDPEAAKFEALYAGLEEGLFDIAMSGQADISADPGSSPAVHRVDWTPPTALLFTNVLYSGRDGYNLSDLAGASRERFIARVKEWPEVKCMCVANPGPSPTNSAELVKAINDAGGNAVLDDTGTLDSITEAIEKQTIHFSIGDGIASAWIGNQPGFKGLNLDIAASTKPLQTAQPVAAFTLRTP